MVTVDLIDGRNQFVINGEPAPILDLIVGNTYIFEQLDPSNRGHQFEISELPEPGRPVDYSETIGIPGQPETESKVIITIPDTANKILHYVCNPHGATMGNIINIHNDEVTIQPIDEDNDNVIIQPIDDDENNDNSNGIDEIDNTDNTDSVGIGGINDTNNTTTTTTISSIEFQAFIKVLSCIRRSDGVSPDPGITKIKIREGGTHFANSVILTVEYNSSVDIGPVNIRLYKNSLNKIDTYNELQWTLENEYLPNSSLIGNEIVNSFVADKPDEDVYNTQTIGGITGVPGSGQTITFLVSKAEYPYHPTEPFTTTTQYSVVDNSMNILGNLYLKGSVNTDLQLAPEKKIGNLNYGIFEEKFYTNDDFVSRTLNPGSVGLWTTIAKTTINIDAKTRAASALFEIIDKSNTSENKGGTANTFKDPSSFNEYILFSVDWQYEIYKGETDFFDTINNVINPPKCSINVLNSICGSNNNTTSAGYISGIRVETNFTSGSGGNNQAVANIQIKRHCNGTLIPTTGPVINQASGVTDVKVRMFANESDEESLKWELSSTPHQFGGAVSGLTNANSNNLVFDLITNNSGIVKSITDSPQGKDTYFDSVKIGIVNDDLDMGENSIENVSIISGNLKDEFPRVEFDNDTIKLLVDNQASLSKIVLGSVNTTNNFSNQQISLNFGSAFGNDLFLDMNGFDIQETNKIASRDANDNILNRAYVIEKEFDLGNLFPQDNDWVSIAYTGEFGAPQNSTNPSVTDDQHKADALFELSTRDGSHHQCVKFYAVYVHGDPSLKVITNTRYSYPRFKELRIVHINAFPGEYLGAILQFKVGKTTSASPGSVYIKVWQNTHYPGWKLPDTSSSSSVEIKIKVDNNPTVYVPDNISNRSGKYGTAYTDEVNVDIETSLDCPQTSKAIFNDVEILGKVENNIDMNNNNIIKIGSISFGQNEEGETSYMIEPVNARTNSLPEIHGLFHYNSFMENDYILSNNVMNLSWGTSIYQGMQLITSTTYDTVDVATSQNNSVVIAGANITCSEENDVTVDRRGLFNAVNLKHDHDITVTIPREDRRTVFKPNGQATGIGNWQFVGPPLVGPQHVGNLTSGQAVEDGKFGWDRVTLSNFTTGSGDTQLPAKMYWVSNQSSQTYPGKDGTKLVFEPHISNETDKDDRTIVKWKNDSIFYPDSKGRYNNARSTIFSEFNIWHHMPQQNMSGYILGATVTGDFDIRHIPTGSGAIGGSTLWDVDANEVQVKLCLIGAKHSTNGATNKSDIIELTDFVTFDATTSGPTNQENYGEQTSTNNNKVRRFFPNNGNGELSNAIFIGKKGDYRAAEPQFTVPVPQVSHPAHGTVNETFDALGIRMKVEIKGCDGQYGNLTNAKPQVSLEFTRENTVTFHFLPLIKK